MPYLNYSSTAPAGYITSTNSDIDSYNRWDIAGTATKYTTPALVALISLLNIVLDNANGSNKTIYDSTFNGLNLFVGAAGGTLMGIFSYLGSNSKAAVTADITQGVKSGWLPSDTNTPQIGLGIVTAKPGEEKKAPTTLASTDGTTQAQQNAIDLQTYTALHKRR